MFFNLQTLQVFLVILVVALVLPACVSKTVGTSVGEKPSATAWPDELVFYNWEDDLPQSVLDAFSAEFGILVRYETYAAMEDAVAGIRAGERYDVVNLDNRYIPKLVAEGRLARLDQARLMNMKNISANFRELVYDPGNHYSIPYNWGTTGLVVRSDLLHRPASRWADLWDPEYAGRIALWRGQRREVIGTALKRAGYSVNTERPDELQVALEALLALRPGVIFVEDYGLSSPVDLLESGQAVIALGFAYDALEGRSRNPAMVYVLPTEGAMLWGENFVIPAGNPNQAAAELLLNYFLRPEVAAEIANQNYYATPNEASFPLIDPQIFNDPVVFPRNEDLVNAEIILPLSQAGDRLYATLWERFLSAVP